MSSHRLAACRICPCRSRRSRSTSAHRWGRATVRRDFLVFVSPPARTERQTMMDGGSPSTSTRDQVSGYFHQAGLRTSIG
jgi:hypothetical protein